MEAEFWRKRWRDGQLGWHQSKAHPFLVAQFEKLDRPAGARIFVPLCGKTLDIGWLLANGFRVAGAELVESAIEQLFAGLGLEPGVSAAGRLKRYSGPGVDIFAGDLFELDAETMGPVDAVYDRAALVALPAAMRTRYAAHLVEITKRAPQLLVTFDYDQRLLDGPPFSVDGEEVSRLYAGAYDLELAESADVAGGLKGTYPALERAWLLR